MSNEYSGRRHGGRSYGGMNTNNRIIGPEVRELAYAGAATPPLPRVARNELLADGMMARAREFWYGVRPIWWRSCWGLRVSGLENLPKSGAMIFCANHTSHLDAAAILAALPKKIALEVTTVAARDVWGERPMRRLIGRVTTNSVSLSRKGDFAAGFRMLDKVLGEGRPIIIFPEGKRSVSGEMGEFKPGAAMLAVRNGAPIVPV